MNAVAQAEAYVRTAFYPPLPYEYGALAVEAVERYMTDPDRPILLPDGLNPVPRGTYEGIDGGLFVDVRDLIHVLRLWHMVDEETEWV